jgi:plasmid maintenance system antidote protein VapI
VAQILRDYEITNRDTAFIPAETVFPELAHQTKRPGMVLRGFRLRDDLTQVKLAKKLACPQPWISQMESGVRPMGKKMAARLSKVFKADLRVFL